MMKRRRKSSQSMQEETKLKRRREVSLKLEKQLGSCWLSIVGHVPTVTIVTLRTKCPSTIVSVRDTMSQGTPP